MTTYYVPSPSIDHAAGGDGYFAMVTLRADDGTPRESLLTGLDRLATYLESRSSDYSLGAYYSIAGDIQRNAGGLPAVEVSQIDPTLSETAKRMLAPGRARECARAVRALADRLTLLPEGAGLVSDVLPELAA